MRNIFTIVLLLFSALAFGQSEPHGGQYTRDTTITQKSNGFTNTYQLRITTYADSKPRPTIFTMPGAGEVGTDTANLTKFGPHYFLNNGWDGGVALSKYTLYPNLVTIEQPVAAQGGNQANAIFDTLFKYYPQFKRGSIHCAGLSDGSAWFEGLVQYYKTAGGEEGMKKVNSLVNLEGVSSVGNPNGFNLTYPSGFGHAAAKYGLKFFGLQGIADGSRNVYEKSENMNDSVPGSAFMTYEQINCGDGSGAGGHGCWNSMYDPTVTDWTSANPNIVPNHVAGHPSTIGTYYAPSSIFAWMLRQGDTSMVVLPNVAQKWNITLGEYTVPAKDSLGRAVLFSANLGLTGNNNTGTAGVPLAIAGSPVMVSTGNTLHGGSFIDTGGNVWVTGGNDQGQLGIGNTTAQPTLVKVATDSRGLPFTDITILQGTYVQVGDTTCEGQLFVKHGTASDTIFFAGHHKYGIGGDGSLVDDTLTAPTLMFGLASGKRVLQLVAEEVAGMLLNDGTVETWGSNQFGSPMGRTVTGTNYATPTQITGFDDSIRQIVGGGTPGFVCLSKTGKLWGWSHYSGYLGNAANTAYNTPTDLTTNITSYILNGTTRTSITQLAGNSTCYHVITNDSTLWGWGDKAMGDLGDGVGANLSSPGGTSTPWFLDPGAVLILPQTHPIQITGKHNFVAAYSGYLFCFHFAALDVNGQLYWCGRNKGGVIPNGVVECAGDGGTLSSQRPNSWDVTYLTPLSPYAVTSTTQQTCLGCYTGQITTGCYTCGTTTGATANAGSNQTISTLTTALNGTASTSSGKLTQYVWTQTSGPTSVIDVPAAAAPNVALSGPGTYVYNLAVQDQGFQTSNASVTVTVSGATPPTVNAGPDLQIILGNTLTLSGTATGNGGATIDSTTWTQVSGPNTATIVSPGSLTTNVTSVILGTYVFKLSATDSNSNTAFDTTTIIVVNINQLTSPVRVLFN